MSLSNEKSKEATVIKGPKKTMTKLSSDLFNELAEEGFARVEGLGTFRKSGRNFEFIPFEDIKMVADSIESSVETEEPHWLAITDKSKPSSKPRSKKTTPQRSNRPELSDVMIPSGRTQQRILEDRYERYQERKIENSKTGSLKTYRAVFGVAAVLALAMLTSPFWVEDSPESVTMAHASETEQSAPSNESAQGSAVQVSTTSTPEKEVSDTKAENVVAEEPKQTDEKPVADTTEDQELKKEEVQETNSEVQETNSPVSIEELKDDPTLAGTRVAEKSKTIAALGPDLRNEKEKSEKESVKVTPISRLKAEVGVGNQFAIIAASMKTVSSAKKMVEDLRAKGFVAEVVVSPVDGGTFYRVVLGRFNTKPEAAEANKALGGEYWVTRLSFASQLLSI